MAWVAESERRPGKRKAGTKEPGQEEGKPWIQRGGGWEDVGGPGMRWGRGSMLRAGHSSKERDWGLVAPENRETGAAGDGVTRD